MSITVKRLTLVVLFLVAFASTGVGAPRSPALTVAETAPPDLRALVSDTWGKFLESFPARLECIAPVIVRGAWELADRGAYDPERRVVTVRIPGTAPNLRATLLHEFAHHLEFTCPQQREMRGAFLAAQGFPPDASWFEGETWGATPSEQFAEAAVRVVLAGRPAHTLALVRPDAVDVVREWANGRVLTHGS